MGDFIELKPNQDNLPEDYQPQFAPDEAQYDIAADFVEMEFADLSEAERDEIASYLARLVLVSDMLMPDESSNIWFHREELSSRLVQIGFLRKGDKATAKYSIIEKPED